jgi:predicted ATPase
MHIRSLRFLHDTFPTKTWYPFSLDVFKKTDLLGFSRPVTFFIGENGTGKSTLLRAIASCCAIHIWEEHEGKRDPKNRYEDLLHQSLRIEWADGKVPGSFFSSENFRHFATRSLIVKSHGQSHMTFFKNRFARRGLYLLDEPENALSPKRQLELLGLLRQLATRGDVQFIIATHSPILLALPEAEIFTFDTSPIRKVRYEDTDYYRVYRDFLDNRGKYLDPL